MHSDEIASSRRRRGPRRRVAAHKPSNPVPAAGGDSATLNGSEAQLREVFADRISTLINDMGGKAEFERRTRIPRNTSNSWLHRDVKKSLPTLGHLVTVARVTGASVDWLAGLDVPRQWADQARFSSLRAHVNDVAVRAAWAPYEELLRHTSDTTADIAKGAPAAVAGVDVDDLTTWVAAHVYSVSFEQAKQVFLDSE